MVRWNIKTRRGRLDLDRTRSVWLRFREYIQPHRRSLFWALLAAVGVIGMQVAAPWPIKIIFDYILSDNMGSSWMARALDRVSSPSGSALAWVCGGILLIAVIDSVFSYIRDVLLAQTGQRVVGQLRQDLFAHLQTLSPPDLARHHTGGLLVRLTSDIQMLRQMLVNAVVTAGENGLLIITMVAVGTSVIMARALGAEGRGHFALALLLPSMLFMFFNFGIGTAGTRFAAMGRWPVPEILASHALAGTVQVLVTGIIGLSLIAFVGDMLFPNIPAAPFLFPP
ncbi:MAG: hypothetical protein IIB53_14730 [Planctomycetes bacterium]|nr:hypothetical protein [Planctomycetota bacterium]